MSESNVKPESECNALLACPFCGGNAEVLTTHPTANSEEVFVECVNCGAQGPTSLAGENTVGKDLGTEEEAIAEARKGWNKRSG